MTRFLAPALIGVVGTAILVALGVWQVQRLDWKEAVLAEIEDRQAQAPVSLPMELDPEVHRFLPVVVEGELLPGPLFVFTSIKGIGVRFRVIQAVDLQDGRRILVELGTINPDLFEQITLSGPIKVEGMAHWPDEVDGFTPIPDLEKNIWYGRDLDGISAALEAAPILVVASRVTPSDPLLLPIPLDPSAIPNDHLQYAVTWFGLAVVWVGMTMLWLRRIARTRHLER